MYALISMFPSMSRAPALTARSFLVMSLPFGSLPMISFGSNIKSYFMSRIDFWQEGKRKIALMYGRIIWGIVSLSFKFVKLEGAVAH